MRTLLFIRHAETDMAGRFCGHSDPELNQRGHAQLSPLIETLRSENLGAVYSSDLRRALATSTAIASAFHLECHVSSAWREIYFGDWEGLSWREIERRDVACSHQWVKMFPNLPAPGGEDVRDFEDRILSAVESLATKPPTRNAAVVTHAGAQRTILHRLQGCSEKEAWEQTKAYGSIVRYVVPSSGRTQSPEVTL